ncbi:hypothetical protein [Formosa algae]|uniref:hypothetical protein n=1 Tax=Formosa algae TaxID=225843 RepID=UPI000CCE9FAA|nr:hypothetical protein [Formosa algae]PNW26693.1 hypothetical protein BKP44_16010 [Formosa algae]
MDSDPLPAHIKNWPETSWLKYFIKYLVCTNRFFVYPKSSLSTNFGDSGSHNINKNLTYQVPLFIGKEQIKLIKIDECLNVYDSHFEILPSRLKRLCPFLTDFDFSTDIYGLKDVNFIETEYLLSSKKTKKNKLPLMTFGLEIKPMLLNIVYKINGDNFTLGYKTNFSEDKFIDVSNSDVFDYMFSHISIKSMVFLVINRLKKRFKRYL